LLLNLAEFAQTQQRRDQLLLIILAILLLQQQVFQLPFEQHFLARPLHHELFPLAVLLLPAYQILVSIILLPLVSLVRPLFITLRLMLVQPLHVRSILVLLLLLAFQILSIHLRFFYALAQPPQ